MTTPNESDSEKRSGAEEFVAAEIELAEPLTPEQEKILRDALGQMPPQTFDSCDIGTEKISVSYDPTRVTKNELLKKIVEAGAKVKRVESEASPFL
ncbi:MAG TPA: hypothetical protein VGG02_07195 [Chthoniobacterales bacterium]|jgi:hypothetical protein